MATRSARVDDEALVQATGKPWSDWRAVLDQAGAGSLTHKQIADLLAGRHGAPGWWAQHLTVRYEQEIGRRAPGQSCNGDFQAGASATRPGDMDGLLAAWRGAHDAITELDGVPVEAPPAVSESEKWRYWRVRLTDGGRVTVMFSDKAPGKATVAVNHEKLDEAEAVERWRAFWKAKLAAFPA